MQVLMKQSELLNLSAINVSAIGWTNLVLGKKICIVIVLHVRIEFDFVKALNSSACQASVERAYSSIARFYDNCKKKVLDAASRTCSASSKLLAVIRDFSYTRSASKRPREGVAYHVVRITFCIARR